MKLIQIANLSHAYGNHQVLKQIVFELNAGEWVAILGPSGAGKSTLLHILGLMMSWNEGHYSLKGEPLPSVDMWHTLRSEVFGFVFQKPYCLPYRTVLDNLLLPLYYSQVPIEVGKKRATLLLDELGLANKLNHYPHQLSGGEQQRISIVRALMNHPSVLLADELTSHLDARSLNQVLDCIKKQTHQRKMACVLITHDEKVAARCDRQYHLEGGVLCPL